MRLPVLPHARTLRACGCADDCAGGCATCPSSAGAGARAAGDAALRHGGRPVRVALVGCGKAKLSGSHAARTLYTGALFRGALAYAERTCEETFVLSALYGLLPLDRVVSSYDVRLASGAAERGRWGRSVAGELERRYAGRPVHLVFLAGAAYVAPVGAAVPGVWTNEAPMAGLQIGERLAWLKAWQHRGSCGVR